MADLPSQDSPLLTAVALTDLLVGLLEYRDRYFRGSSSLAGLVTVAVGRELGLGDGELQELGLAALLRDLGRVAAGGELVGRSTTDPRPQEQERIERHIEIGLALLDGIDLPPAVRSAIRHHHERWDGEGYPDALAGEDIPLAARIVAVADSFSAMIRPRPYRPPLRVTAALDELRGDAGVRYDPRVVQALVDVLGRPDRPIFGASPGHHVLIVGEDELRGLVLAAWLCQHGFLAEVSPELGPALERLERVPVAAIVLAADGDRSDLPSQLAAIRRRRPAGKLPVIVLDVPLGHGADLREAGADAWLPVGARPPQLRALLAELIQRADVGWAISPSEPEPAWHALNGSLAGLGLSWVLQALKYDGRTARIVVRSPQGYGDVFVEEGEPSHAVVGADEGETALRSMLGWREGSFVVRLDVRTSERTIEGGLMRLLLEDAVATDQGQILGALPAG